MHDEPTQTTVTDDESLPWIPFLPYSDSIMLKVMRVDPVRDQMVLLIKAPALAELPRYRHSGTVVAYTTHGRWKYLEHHWIAGPGSLLFDTAALAKTPQVVSEDSGVHIFNVITGPLLMLDANDQLLATENWRSMLERYHAYCEGCSIVPCDITAGA